MRSYQCTSALARHKLKHRSEVKKYNCIQCEKSYERSDALKSHLRVHLKRFTCQMCSFSSTIKNGLRIHMLVHKEEKIFSCEHCKYVGEKACLS